jgi:luciferase family oxidoreductase group 1
MGEVRVDGIAVSVLDLVTLKAGDAAENAVGNAITRSVDLARHVEEWGYRRFWLAEHHAIAGIASAATAVLIGHIAGATKSLRVGSGGVMLPNHAPLVVAEQFGTLEAMYPGRIDLGLGRAPGGDWATKHALRRGLGRTFSADGALRDGDEFPDLLAELRGYLGPERPGQAVKAIPGQGSDVPVTLLGSSLYSAQLAARLGLPFAFAAHFAPGELYEAARLYRMKFQAGLPGGLERPHLMVAVPVIAAETDARAAYLLTSALQRFLKLVRGQAVELVPPVESMDVPAPGYVPWSVLEREAVYARLGAAIVGSEATVRTGLEKLVERTGADEVIVVTDLYEQADRLESYRRVAEVARQIARQAAQAEARTV